MSHLISVNSLSFPFSESQRGLAIQLANIKSQKLDVLFSAIHHLCEATGNESRIQSPIQTLSTPPKLALGGRSVTV